MRLPSKNLLSQWFEYIRGYWFCKKVRQLVCSVDLCDGDFSTCDVIAKVVQFDVEMFCLWTKLVVCRYFKCSAIVFEDFAFDVWFGRFDWEFVLLHFL